MIPPAPDAGRSYLGHYSIVNPWTVWLLNRAPELLTEPASRLTRTDAYAPLCHIGRPHRMVLRPGEWVCYLHDVRVKIEPKYERAPKADVLSRTAEMLDYVWDDLEGRYAIVSLP